MLLNNRGYYEAWRLQYLTDLTKLPDYEDGYFYYREYNGAPVDAEGKPVYHTLPKSWEAAETDGQRWRWALSTGGRELARPAERSPVRSIAQFFEQQFGVQTMADGRLPRPRIRRAAIGRRHQEGRERHVRPAHAQGKRNDRQAGHRHQAVRAARRVQLHQDLPADRRRAQDGHGRAGAISSSPRSSRTAGSIRGRPKYWQESIAKFGAGQNNWKQQRLDQIVGNWGRFEGTTSQPAGKGATVDFRFRNGKKVEVRRPRDQGRPAARRREGVPQDRSGQPHRLEQDQHRQHRLPARAARTRQKYLGDEVADWELDLEPRDEPLRPPRHRHHAAAKGRARTCVTAKMAGGNVSKIVVWVADTAIVKKQLERQDALLRRRRRHRRSRSPEANVEFFGWQQRHLGGNRYQVVTTNFAENDRRRRPCSRPIPSDLKQRIPVARHRPRRRTAGFAYLGFTGVWYGQYSRRGIQPGQGLRDHRPARLSARAEGAVQVLGAAGQVRQRQVATSPARRFRSSFTIPRARRSSARR